MTIETNYNIGDEVWGESLGVPNMIKIHCFTIEVKKDKAPSILYVGMDKRGNLYRAYEQMLYPDIVECLDAIKHIQR